MKQNSVMILGGGASGLAAAIVAARQGEHVTLLERSDRVGRKLLATGNGRCNLANLGEPVYFGDTAFALEVLRRMPPRQVLDFFDALGLPTRADAAGRVYPACGQAAAVLDVLRCHLAALGVRVVTQAEVTGLRQAEGGWQAETAQGVFSARRALVCCGGLAAPKLGAADASGLLTGLGCRLIPPAPALAPLETEKGPIKGLSGLRLPATLTLCGGKTPAARVQGEALFADYGVSGVCAMQLAREAWHLLRGGREAWLYMDFSPALGIGAYHMGRLEPAAPDAGVPALAAWLREREGRMPPGDALLGAVPRVLREKLRGVPARELPRMLAAYPLRVTGVRGFDQAQVTQGGIDPRDFSPATMEHKKLPGLHACGELLNVDGDCGGFNLQFAFATGILAARNGRAAE